MDTGEQKQGKEQEQEKTVRAQEVTAPEQNKAGQNEEQDHEQEREEHQEHEEVHRVMHQNIATKEESKLAFESLTVTVCPHELVLLRAALANILHSCTKIFMVVRKYT